MTTLPTGTKFQVEERDGTLSPLRELAADLEVIEVASGLTYNVYLDAIGETYFVLPENE